MLTVTPVLAVKWPDFGGKSIIMIKTTPVWIQRHSIQKRGIIDKLKKFFQLSLSAQLPVIVTGTLKLCTLTCPATRPLEAQLQVGLGNFKTSFSGIGLKGFYSIPIKLTSAPIGICLPFFNICKRMYLNFISRILNS
jgi:hypothetical protein